MSLDNKPEPESTRRAIQHDGETWIVEVAGRGVSGTGRFADRGIQLVRFHCEARSDDTVLEVVTPLFDLDLALDPEILELLRVARPPVERRPPDTHYDDESAGSVEEPLPDEAQ